MRTRRMRSLTWRRKPTATSLPAAVGQADVERLVEQHEVGIGLRRRLAGERPPLVAQRLEDGRVVARAEPAPGAAAPAARARRAPRRGGASRSTSGTIGW